MASGCREFKPGDRAVDWPWFGSIVDEAEIEAVSDLLLACQKRRRRLDAASGDVKAFEDKFAAYVGAKHAIAVNSCGTGLDMCTDLLEIAVGDEVITTGLTFCSTALSIVQRGAKPVAADIDPGTFNLDPAAVKSQITPRTKAVWAMHYAGLAMDMDGLLELARERGLAVVEDAAHAAGASYRGRKVGAIGDITVFSFQSQKNITTLGEGGMLTTDNDDYAAGLRRLRAFGVQPRKGWSYPAYPYHPMGNDILEIASNYRMTPPQAVAGIAQLDKLDANNERRRWAADSIIEGLRGLEGITAQEVPTDCVHARFHCPLLLDGERLGINKYEFLQLMATEYKVTNTINYLPWYHFSLFEKMGCRKDQTPITDRVFEQLFAVPIHPEMSEEDVAYAAWAIRDAVERMRTK